MSTCNRNQINLHSYPTRRSSDLPKKSRSVRAKRTNDARKKKKTSALKQFPNFFNELVFFFFLASFVQIGRAPSELQSRRDLVCRLLLEQKYILPLRSTINMFKS